MSLDFFRLGANALVRGLPKNAILEYTSNKLPPF